MNISPVAIKNNVSVNNLAFGRKHFSRTANDNKLSTDVFEKKPNIDFDELIESQKVATGKVEDSKDSDKEDTIDILANRIIENPSGALELFDNKGYLSFEYVNQQDNKTVSVSLKGYDELKESLLNFASGDEDVDGQEPDLFSELEDLEVDILLIALRNNLSKKIHSDSFDVSKEDKETLQVLDVAITRKIYAYRIDKEKINRLGEEIFASTLSNSQEKQKPTGFFSRIFKKIKTN